MRSGLAVESTAPRESTPRETTGKWSELGARRRATRPWRRPNAESAAAALRESVRRSGKERVALLEGHSIHRTCEADFF